MEGSERLLNPLMVFMRRMESELSCPACSKLLSMPMLLPCGHILCSQCIEREDEYQSDCPACLAPFPCGEIRHYRHIETIVNIFRSINDAAFAALQQLHISGIKEPSKESSVSGLSNTDTKQRSSQVASTCMKVLFEEDNFSSRNDAEGKSQLEMVHDMHGGKSSKVHIDPPVSGYGNITKHRDDGKSELAILNSKKCVQNAGEEAFLKQGESCSPQLLGNSEVSLTKKNSVQERSEIPSTSLPIKGSCKKVTETGIGLKRDLSLPTFTNQLTIDIQNSARSNDAKSRTLTSRTELEILREPKRRKRENETECDHATRSFHTSSNSYICSVDCVFCHLSEISEFTGKIVHYYINGRPAAAGEEKLSNVIHFHEKCFEWAPQANFKCEIAMNLEDVLSRSSKIICGKCKQKGAALGCYVEDCSKSYHVPCAVTIPGCRWDCENLCMLCPSHSSFKLPCEESTRKIDTKHAATTQMESSATSEQLISISQPQKDGLWTSGPSDCSQWMLCASDLSTLNQELLDKFGRLTGAAVTGKWKANVTHVIVSTDEAGACNRSQKVLMAILHGKWVLNIDWIRVCMEAGHPVAEEPYEVNLDVFGCSNGPKKGRLRVEEKAPKIFFGLKFYFSKHFKSLYRAFLKELVVVAGGTVLEDDNLTSKYLDAKESSYIVINVDPPEGCDSKDYGKVIDERCDEAEALSLKIGYQIISDAWLLETIALCNTAMDLRKGCILL